LRVHLSNSKSSSSCHSERSEDSAFLILENNRQEELSPQKT